LNSLVCDHYLRMSIAGNNLTWGTISRTPLPPLTNENISVLNHIISPIAFQSHSLRQHAELLELEWSNLDGLNHNMRLALSDAYHAIILGLTVDEVLHISRECGYSEPKQMQNLDVKGFWRVNANLPPNDRRTVLFPSAYIELQTRTIEDVLENGISDETIGNVVQRLGGDME
jgi:hypothetical protein